jgi:integrase
MDKRTLKDRMEVVEKQFNMVIEFNRAGRVWVEDGLSLYRHPRSPFIWADHWVSGKGRVRKSTGKKHVEHALLVVREQREKLLQRAAEGEPLSGEARSVGDALKGLIEELRREAGSDPKRLRNFAVYENTIRNNLIPFWSGVRFRRAGAHDVERWKQWRLTSNSDRSDKVSYQKNGKIVEADRPPHQRRTPRDETLSREKAFVSKAFDWATRQTPPWCKLDDVPNLRMRLPRKKKGDVSRRPAFDSDDVRAMINRFAVWRQSNKAPGHYDRMMLACYVRLLLASGLRPGEEANELCWWQIERVDVTDRMRTLVLHDVNGKTGVRNTVCLPEALSATDDLRSLLAEYKHSTEGSAPLFPMRGGVVGDLNSGFTALLKELGIKPKPRERPYSLYSCRHTYITMQILDGVDALKIAENCGTSLAMIQRHYGHLKPRSMIRQLIPQRYDER